MRYYPAFLDLQGKVVLVVGGGSVAEQKVSQLLQAGATVQVVSPQTTPSLKNKADQGLIRLQLRPFQESDLDGVLLVVGATGETGLQKELAAACRKRNLFCNIVDVPSLCSFIVPAVVQRGDISVAISTGGKSPAMAGYLKKVVAQAIPNECVLLTRWLGRLRPLVQKRIGGTQKRARFYTGLIHYDLLGLLREQRFDEARRYIRERFEAASQG